MLPAFDFQPRTRIVFGPDKVDTLGELARELGCQRALVVSDPGIVSAGHTDRGLRALAAAGVACELFTDVSENPTTDHVNRGVEFARRVQPDLLIGLGGGSSMDCAKGINFVYSCGGRMQDYWGVGKATKPMLPMIAVPTTSGTGSEAQSFALISDAETHVKMACGDKKAACRVAVLDPTLTVTQPARVTALTGIDALAHALETYVTNRRNPMSILFSREAFRLLELNFGRVLRDPNDLEARSGMQLGACLAGFAIELSMLGAAHALANPLTAHYGIVHGQAVAVMLPHVIRYNGAQVGNWYRELLDYSTQIDVAELNGSAPADHGTEGLARFVEEMVAQAGLATRLSACDVDQNKLPQLAEDAAKQWTGGFNPRPVATGDLLELYQAAW